MTSVMKELTDKKTECQNILFTIHRQKTISFGIYFRSLLPKKIAGFYNASLLKYIKLTKKSSVRVLRGSYLPLFGEKAK
jgi:hypothetical protein